MSNADLIARLRVSQHRLPNVKYLRGLAVEAAAAIAAADKTIVALQRLTNEVAIPLDLKVIALEQLAPNAPPIFHHLFAMLPNPGDEFPSDKRIAFLRAVSAVAEVVYGPAALSIELERAAALTDGTQKGDDGGMVRANCESARSSGEG